MLKRRTRRFSICLICENFKYRLVKTLWVNTLYSQDV
jgi:hypothetical protein